MTSNKSYIIKDAEGHLKVYVFVLKNTTDLAPFRKLGEELLADGKADMHITRLGNRTEVRYNMRPPYPPLF